MVITVYFMLLLTTLFSAALFILFSYLFLRKMYLNYHSKRSDTYYHSILLNMTAYVTSDSGQAAGLLAVDALWKKRVIKSTILEIAEVIDSDEARERLITIADANGMVQEVEEMIEDQRWWIAAEGISIAGKLHLVQFTPSIKQHLYAKEFDLLYLSAKALCQMGRSQYIVDYLLENDQRLPQKAVVHLGDIMTRGTNATDDLDYIVSKFKQASPRLQELFIEIIGKKKAARYLPLITFSLHSPSNEIRLQALRAIGNIGIYLVEEPILASLLSEQWQERVLAVYVVHKCKMERGIPMLENHSLKDPNWWVRLRAAQALYDLGTGGKSRLKWASEHHEDKYARDIANKVLQEKNLRGKIS
ncbi:HEAT repeat domain-containing protein [Priestia abyssalis]|uniref:HEAT repeat domain-containing protein n=1 Tax=Priestia abyssalis TaxID=1221450 RepID=UPI000994A149|nr:HEAT repeat domain-containing protein [Priestia abyssalis]